MRGCAVPLRAPSWLRWIGSGFIALSMAGALSLLLAPPAEGKPKVRSPKIGHPPPHRHRVLEGSLPAPQAGASCPEEMANIEGRFCVDRYEASLVEVLADGSERPWSPFKEVPRGVRVRARSGAGVYPQGYISGETAERACALAGKRLCNPTEWRKACMGPEGFTFGYGPRREPGRCNDHGRSPMLELYPRVSVSWRLVGMVEMNDPRLNQLAGSLAKTGEHPGCTNGYGVVDMVGNLHEWTSDPNGTFQGGYYLDTTRNGDGCNYRTAAHEFTYHDYSTGFRCCADVTVHARRD